MLLILIAIMVTVAMTQVSPAAQTMEVFQEKYSSFVGAMTTSAGAPVSYSEATYSFNSRLFYNEFFMDSVQHLSQERIPERVVHAKGGGAFGYFEVTKNITNICKAKLFDKVGKKIPIAARFSPIITEKGGPDTSRDARGFAIKFYTEEGNFDMVGLSMPVFVVKDPLFFLSFVHSQKKNPASNLCNATTFWDFLTARPESFHIFLYVFGDTGIPDGYGNMPGFSIHTFQTENENGELYFVRFHFVPRSGIKTLTSEEARRIQAVDADYNTRSLYNSIRNGDFPVWTVNLQILSEKDVERAGPNNVFDVTKILPLDKYPLIEIGKLVLNRNALNYFAEIEQLAFNPANLVPGIIGAPDKLFEARRLAYREALSYRLSANFNKILVNCPFRSTVFTYNRDGKPPVFNNELNIPNYYPSGPVPRLNVNSKPVIDIVEEEPNNLEQCTELYVNGMTKEQRCRLISNILYSLAPATKFVQQKAVTIFTRIHPDLGSRIKQGLLSNLTNYE